MTCQLPLLFDEDIPCEDESQFDMPYVLARLQWLANRMEQCRLRNEHENLRLATVEYARLQQLMEVSA